MKNILVFVAFVAGLSNSIRLENTEDFDDPAKIQITTEDIPTIHSHVTSVMATKATL